LSSYTEIFPSSFFALSDSQKNGPRHVNGSDMLFWHPSHLGTYFPGSVYHVTPIALMTTTPAAQLPPTPARHQPHLSMYTCYNSSRVKPPKIADPSASVTLCRQFEHDDGSGQYTTTQLQQPKYMSIAPSHSWSASVYTLYNVPGSYLMLLILRVVSLVVAVYTIHAWASSTHRTCRCVQVFTINTVPLVLVGEDIEEHVYAAVALVVRVVALVHI
jgi:hypothetical protein